MMTHVIESLTALVGRLVCLYVLIKLAAVFYKWFLRPATSWKAYRGEWALVSASSDGLGKEFAFALARRGLNVVVTGRSKVKLEAVTREIESRYGVRTRSVAIDFLDDPADGKPDPYAAIERAVAGLTVSVLVNSAGGAGSTSAPLFTAEEWHRTSLEQQRLVHLLNVRPAFRLTHMLLPSMMERHKGAILNVGSLASVCGPLVLNYASDKAKINGFSRGLAAEVTRHGITVECCILGPVVTASLVKPKSLLTPLASRVAEDSLKSFGCGPTVRCPYIFHALVLWGLQWMPERMLYEAFRKGTHQTVIENGL